MNFASLIQDHCQHTENMIAFRDMLAASGALSPENQSKLNSLTAASMDLSQRLSAIHSEDKPTEEPAAEPAEEAPPSEPATEAPAEPAQEAPQTQAAA